jgi:hypothetical protein
VLKAWSQKPDNAAVAAREGILDKPAFHIVWISCDVTKRIIYSAWLFILILTISLSTYEYGAGLYI